MMQESFDIISVQRFWDFLESGGPIMIPIGLCSVIAFGLTIERIIRLRHNTVIPAQIIDAIELIKKGHFDEAGLIIQKNDSPAGRILQAGMRRKGFPLGDIERAMEEQGLKEMEKLRSNIRGLSVIANLSPLLGLLGTVIGIAEAFHRVVTTGLGKPEYLASGIEEALTTTIAGLVVAIPAMLFAAYLTEKARKLIIKIDEHLSQIVEVLSEPGEGKNCS